MSFVRFETLNYFSKYCITGSRKPCEKDHYFPPNWHKEPEIFFCKNGVAKVVQDDREYTIKEGNIIIINPNVIHSIRCLTDLDFYCFHIDSKYLEANFPCVKETFFSEFIESDKEVLETLEDIVKEHKNDDELKTVKLKFLFLKLFIFLVENYNCSTATSAYSSKTYSRVKIALSYIEKNLNRDLTLEEIAASAGINKYQLAREFKHATQRSVFQYINYLRCKTAMAMLKSGSTATEAALNCGFKNLSYFSKTYKKYMGEIPTKAKKSQ